MCAIVRRGFTVALAAALLTLGSSAAHAQVLGTFNFQLQPYCNVVTMTLTQEGSTFRLAGWDDNCGASKRYPMSGTVTQNPDGTYAFGFVITRDSGQDVHTMVQFNAATISGPWVDSAGNGGTFAFNGTGGGQARPGPAVSPNLIRTLTDDNAVLNGFTSTCEDIAAVNFGTVAAGTLVCTATVHSVFNHTNGALSRLEFDVATAQAACAGNPQAGVFEMAGVFPSVTGQDVTVPVTRAFAVTAGPLVVYLNARTVTLPAADELGHSFSCTFTPQ